MTRFALAGKCVRPCGPGSDSSEPSEALPDDEANTVAGLVIHEAQMIPEPGQVFSFHGFRFEVMGRKDNRISKLKIRPL